LIKIGIQLNTLDYNYTQETRKWLDERYMRDENGIFRAHRPIYGFGIGPSERNHTIRFGIALGILKTLNSLEWNTLIDVGGGEGYLSWIIRRVFNKEAFTSELSFEANKRAGEFFGLQGITADIHRLPFKTDSFDIVLASEVIEHLQYPHIGLYEILRVAKKAVLFTTAEAYSTRFEQKLRLKTRNFNALHGERNYWHPDDFKNFFNYDIEILTCTKAFMDIDERSIDENEAKILVEKMTTLDNYDRNALDALILIKKYPKIKTNKQLDEKYIIDRLFSGKVEHNTKAEKQISFPKELLCCPACRNDLIPDKNTLVCTRCNTVFPIIDNIPVLMPSEKIYQISAEEYSAAGIKLEGVNEYIDRFVKSEKSVGKITKLYSVIMLTLKLFERFIKSDVNFQIKIKWLKNKANLKTFNKYFIK
jgi:uncharacterized protein YbaR (Trm112 family)